MPMACMWNERSSRLIANHSDVAVPSVHTTSSFFQRRDSSPKHSEVRISRLLSIGLSQAVECHPLGDQAHQRPLDQLAAAVGRLYHVEVLDALDDHVRHLDRV